MAIAAGDGWLRVSVRGDGRGAPSSAEDRGRVGLVDRVEALGGTLSLTSPPGRGAAIEAELPLTGPGPR